MKKGNPDRKGLPNVLFYSSVHHALDYIALREKIEHYHGQNGQQGRREDQVPLLKVGAGEGRDGDGNGLHRPVRSQNQQGEQIVVPNPDPVQYHYRDDDGLEQGKDDLKKRTLVGTAVDDSCLFQLIGYVLDKPVENENGKG